MILNYNEFGEGKTIVILHGLLGSLGNWVSLAKVLSERFHVILVDLPNHGQSHHTDHFSYEVMAKEVSLLLKHNEWYNINLIGHSMGGKVAMKYAELFSENISKLVIVDIANRNLMKFNLEDKIEIYRSNWFSEVNGKFDIIVSNPPYVDSNEIEKLDNGVKNFDPYVSLNGGKFGLECFKKISSIAGNFLKKNGYICVELGCGQKKDVQSIFTKNGFHKIIESKDLLNIDRVLVFKNKI